MFYYYLLHNNRYSQVLNISEFPKQELHFKNYTLTQSALECPESLEHVMYRQYFLVPLSWDMGPSVHHGENKGIQDLYESTGVIQDIFRSPDQKVTNSRVIPEI